MADTDQENGGQPANLNEVNDYLDTLKKSVDNELDQAARIMDDHLSNSQLVVASVAALRSTKDPLPMLIEALKAANENPTQEAIA